MGDQAGLAVITGAASGIGMGLAKCAHRRGYRLLLADIDAVSLEKVGAELEGARCLVTDVTSEEDVESLAELADQMGGPTLLFNNAGIMTMGFSWEISRRKWDRAYAVNVGGVVNGIRSFVPRMLKRGTPSRIVNTASVGGFFSGPLMAPYSATKFAVVALTEALKLELDQIEAPIAVSLLAPGAVRSDIFVTPAEGASPDEEKFARSMLSLMDRKGLDPETFGERTFDQLEQGEYWIIPQPEALDERLKVRTEMILNREQPSSGKVKGR